MDFYVQLRKLLNAYIVFDLFHVVAGFNRVIDKIRKSEYRKAARENKDVFKGSKYLLLKNRSKVRTKHHRQQLKQLLQINEVINTAMILKEQVKNIWTYRSRTWAGKALNRWCALARSLNHHALNSFSKCFNDTAMVF